MIKYQKDTFFIKRFKKIGGWNMSGLSFYKNKKVLITGHTGFKGSWICMMLAMAGADVTGYALKPPASPALFDICRLPERINSIEGDVRDLEHMKSVFDDAKPEIVIHMAAQPIVRESYKNPVYTYETNVMGTVNALECTRLTNSVKSFVNVTTDKVYLNKDCDWKYREDDKLNGYDPYSNSKSCSELVTSSYLNSFFKDAKVAVSTARAGNVIGGGDFATDRIIPDCIRAAGKKEDIIVRNPFSIRPFEHVIEPLSAYLMIAKAQYEDKKYAGSYNVGPDDTDCVTVGELATLFCDKWNKATGDNVKWIERYAGGPHEAGCLKLDCSQLKNTFGWQPRWSIETAIEKTVEWHVAYISGKDVSGCMERQIMKFYETL